MFNRTGLDQADVEGETPAELPGGPHDDADYDENDTQQRDTEPFEETANMDAAIEVGGLMEENAEGELVMGNLTEETEQDTIMVDATTATLSVPPLPSISSSQDGPTGNAHVVTRVPIDLQVVENLSFPEAMIAFGFGRLTLVDFPMQPHVPVCLCCKSIFDITVSKRLADHYQKCKSSNDSTTPTQQHLSTKQDDEEEITHAQEDIHAEEDIPMEDVRVGGEEEPQGEAEGQLLDPNDEQAAEDDIDEPVAASKILIDTSAQGSSHNYRKAHIGELTKYLTVFPLSKVTQYPTQPIPSIPFAKPAILYTCPIQNCPRSFTSESEANTHINKHPAQDDSTDDFLAPVPCPAQKLFAKNITTRFRIIPEPIETRTVLTLTDKVRDKLQVKNESSSRLIDGPQQLNLFMKKMGYFRVFPEDRANYNDFVNQRMPKVTMIHHARQPAIYQLLTIAVFVYLMDGRHQLRSTDHLIWRHFGNKLRYGWLLTTTIV
jgi:hypothetical protein